MLTGWALDTRPFLLHAENGDDAVKEEDETDSISSPIRRRRGRRSSLRASDSKLGVDKREKDTSRSISVDSHPDERQIKLDTDRSFVLYGVGEPLHEVAYEVAC